MTSANSNYAHATGTDHYYKVSLFTGHQATDGAYQLCLENGSMWMFDVMTSHQFKPKVRRHEFQVWSFKRKGKTDEFRALCTDGNGNKIVAQIIQFSDFKYDHVEFFMEGKIILLPSEH